MTLAFPLIVALLGQAPPAPSTENPGDPAARLEFMKKSVATYNVRPAESRRTTYRLQPEPIIRFTNPVGQSRDGAIFLWLGEQDRPEASIQVFVIQSGLWLHEFTSLSTGPLNAESTTGLAWTPQRGGLELKPVPGAPKPAESAERRLRQMRDLAQEFAAEDDFQGESWQKLRLLPKPFARYGKPGTDLIDGALFSFVLTTDPEVYLMIEARNGTDGAEWHYAFAPMTSYAVKGLWKGKEVWSLPWRRGATPNDPFVDLHYPSQ
jgi:hypothetical protein